MPSEIDPVTSSAFAWALARPPIRNVPSVVVSQAPEEADDAALIARVRAAYRAALVDFGQSASFWDTTFGQLKRPIHDALTAPDAEMATAMLRNPSGNTHFWGFDAICAAPPGMTEPHELVLRNLDGEVEWRTLYARWLHDGLVSLAEAVGCQRTFYPETTPGYHYDVFGEPSDVDKLLDEIEARIGGAIRFPNPYAGEMGLPSRRGIIGFRSLQSVYQAWRLLQLAAGRQDFRVLEIGAGLGRTAYFAIQFGLVDYTIVDIPMTNAAQGYFLGRVLGPDQVALFGEGKSGKVRALPPQAIGDMTETFDLVLNVDSLTEMSEDVALNYWNFARSHADAILSINHELNPRPVNALYRDDPSVRATRHPYWMHRSYVEEYVAWKHRRARRE